MLIDKDTNPNDTILYLSAVLLDHFREVKTIKINNLDDFLNDVLPKQPSFKLQLSVNFLYLIDKIEIKEGVLSYVP
ncbi:hypothetical protein TMU01_07980 [Tenuibacillus multivorans]|uniref:Uncharacterized protein n=1 Tax=Tenuibacillus multivorans TaxID=237069 RepID=A0A1H0DGE8_9BACI|nr:hypothetical protein [Tenuibacillus multivorans]GEL76563.1 hypothetical protein TMU01_07980 [Tenuibacillus multivorans]SDN69232.1 hypothetical protein SAMN05216498_2862 [Tenuibacillus multivorans]